jgi:hypothetical protein
MYYRGAGVCAIVIVSVLQIGLFNGHRVLASSTATCYVYIYKLSELVVLMLGV